MNKVAPKVVAISATSAVPGLAVTAPGAAAAAARRVGAMIHSSAHADKIIQGATHAAQVAEPFIVPGPPMAASLPGLAGAVVNELRKQHQEKFGKGRIRKKE